MTTAAHKSAVPDSTKDAGSRQVHGNLHFLLNAYDQNNDNASIGGIEGNAPSSDSISLQLDQMGRERSSTLGSIRERGLTFGSEFDLGLGLAGDNVSHDAFFDLSAVNAQKVNVVSAQNSNASGIPTANNVQKHHAAGGDQAQPQDVYDNSSQVAGFLSGMFNNNNSNNTGNSTNTSQINNGLPGHTPPTATATSYEIKHFGKRARSNVSFVLTLQSTFINCWLVPYLSFDFIDFFLMFYTVLGKLFQIHRAYQEGFVLCQILKTED